MAEHYRPHAYQQLCTQAIIDKPAVALWVEMGLGKTAATLAAIHTLLYDTCTISKVLVVAPKKVAEATWQDEAAKWVELQDLTFSTVMGTAAERRRALKAPADIYVTNRDNVAWLVKTLGRKWDFDMAVLDEASSFKSHSAQRFRALKAVRPRIRKLVELTGTPMPNGYEDIWAQIYLLDLGERLGRYVTHYRRDWLMPTAIDSAGHPHRWQLRPGLEDAINARLRDIVVSVSAADHLNLPPLVLDDIPVQLTAAEMRQYRTLRDNAVLQLPDGEIKATQAAAVTNKLLQLCAGAAYDADGGVHQFSEAKLDALDELIDALAGQSALVFYGFRFERESIRLRLKTRHKGLKFALLEGDAQAQAWNRGEIDILLAQPASCAYGLNLQRGGRHIIWYTLPWSLELYQQANARLYRQGQTGAVIVHRLLVRGGMDTQVAKALEAKGATQASVTVALKSEIRQLREAT